MTAFGGQELRRALAAKVLAVEHKHQ